MYPIPEDLDFSPIYGKKVSQICISSHSIVIQLDDEFSISIEGEIERKKSSKMENNPINLTEKASMLISLLDQKIKSVKRKSENELIVIFENSERVHLLNQLAQYESFQIFGPDFELIV